MSAQHTAGPWEWFIRLPGEKPYLATPDRGRLYVMAFGRKGMQGATPRFATWPGMCDGEDRGRRGGIMVDGPVLTDGSLHPDARLIAAAPDLLEAAYKLIGDHDPASDDRRFDGLRAAIDKALGGPQP